MKINSYNVTFWFNVYNNHNVILKSLQEKLKDEYKSFNVNQINENDIGTPIIIGVNEEERTNVRMGRIRLDYSMDKVDLNDLEKFTKRVEELYDILTEEKITVLYSSLFVNGSFEDKKALKTIKNSYFNDKFSKDLVDINLRFGTRIEDTYYKIMSFLNRKEVKLPKTYDREQKLLPVMLIPLQNAIDDKDCIEFTYELNDRCAYDFESDYSTKDVNLNKMIYILKNNMIDDIKEALDKGAELK